MSADKTTTTDTPSSVGSTVLSMLMATTDEETKKEEESSHDMEPIVKHVLKNHWADLPDLENVRMRVEDMSLFIAHVSSYNNFDDEHVIPIEIEEQVSKKVEGVVREMRIGEIRRIDLKINKNANTREKYIDAFVHLYWFNNLPAMQAQAEINVYGRIMWPLKEADRTRERQPFWIIRKNNNPMSLEEVRLMKDLGAAIREMLSVHEEIKKKVNWPEIERYIQDIDSIVRYDLAHAPQSKSPYGPRYDFMWLKYIKCKEATHSMRFHTQLTNFRA
jgi:hypothetical protein